MATHWVIKGSIYICPIYRRIKGHILPVLALKLLKVVVMGATKPKEISAAISNNKNTLCAHTLISKSIYGSILMLIRIYCHRQLLENVCYVSLVTVGNLAELPDCHWLLLNVVLCKKAWLTRHHLLDGGRYHQVINTVIRSSGFPFLWWDNLWG